MKNRGFVFLAVVLGISTLYGQELPSGTLGGGRLEFLSTHPAPENRAAKLKELAARLEPVYVAAKAQPPAAQRYVNLK